MTDRSRHRLVLNASLNYLTARGAIQVSGWPRTNNQQITTELALTPEERTEAIEIANDMECYFQPCI